MNYRRSEMKLRGLTLLDLIMVIAALFILFTILVAVVLPRFAQVHHGPHPPSCVNNLRQIGLSFLVWQGDNNDKFPMQVSATNGGAMEFVGGQETFRCFEVMSNELSTPKILLCPLESDRWRTLATAWRGDPASAGRVPFAGNFNTSFFIGVDATNLRPGMFLSGDHNIDNGDALNNGILELTTNRPARWTATMHINQGNIALADGSVRTLGTTNLQNALEQTGTNKIRLAMP
jgi:prepilin-type processing-associated H-X9-DG protein